MYLHYVQKPIPCCYAVCTFLRIILSINCFLEYDAAGGYSLSAFEVLLHHKQLMNTIFPGRQLVRIGIMCLYTIYMYLL